MNGGRAPLWIWKQFALSATSERHGVLAGGTEQQIENINMIKKTSQGQEADLLSDGRLV
jgi:hypothetical protein